MDRRGVKSAVAQEYTYWDIYIIHIPDTPGQDLIQGMIWVIVRAYPVEYVGMRENVISCSSVQRWQLDCKIQS